MDLGDMMTDVQPGSGAEGQHQHQHQHLPAFSHDQHQELGGHHHHLQQEEDLCGGSQAGTASATQLVLPHPELLLSDGSLQLEAQHLQPCILLPPVSSSRCVRAALGAQPVPLFQWGWGALEAGRARAAGRACS